MNQAEQTLSVILGILLIFAFALLWVARRGDRLDREEKHPHAPRR